MPSPAPPPRSVSDRLSVRRDADFEPAAAAEATRILACTATTTPCPGQLADCGTFTHPAHLSPNVVKCVLKMFSVVLFRSFLATYCTTKHIVHVTFCHQLNVDTNLAKDFSGQLSKTSRTSSSIYLLPAKRDVQLTTRLRCARQYPTICARTNRYKNSFILFGLNHFQ